MLPQIAVLILHQYPSGSNLALAPSPTSIFQNHPSNSHTRRMHHPSHRPHFFAGGSPRNTHRRVLGEIGKLGLRTSSHSLPSIECHTRAPRRALFLPLFIPPHSTSLSCRMQRTYSRSEPCIPDSPQSFVAAQLIPPSFPSTFSPPPSSFISILLSPLISLPSTDRVRRARYCRLLVPPPLHDSPGYYLVLYALQPHPVSGCVDARRRAIPRENANVGAAGISGARCAAHSGFIARRKRRCSPGLFPNPFADEEK